MLGSYICRFKSRGPQRVYRCDIDHSSPLVGIHAWQPGFGEKERGSEHKRNDLPPFCFWKLSDGRDVLDARVVHQDVYLAFSAGSICHESLNIICVPQVCCLETRSLQFTCNCAPSFGVDVGYCYPYALPRKIAGNRQANAGGCACHERNLAWSVCHSIASCSSYWLIRLFRVDLY